MISVAQPGTAAHDGDLGAAITAAARWIAANLPVSSLNRASRRR